MTGQMRYGAPGDGVELFTAATTAISNIAKVAARHDAPIASEARS